MIKQYYKAFLVAIIILYGSLTSGENLEGFKFIPFDNFDKVIHFGMYFTLFLVLYKSITLSYTVIFIKIKTLLFVILYGFLMEIMQKYVSINRSFEFIDLLANTTGAIFGLLIYPFIIRIRWIYKLL